MNIHIDSKSWALGFKDSYAGKPSRPETELTDALSYSSGRVEGEALRLKHQHEFEQQLFAGARVRP